MQSSSEHFQRPKLEGYGYIYYILELKRGSICSCADVKQGNAGKACVLSTFPGKRKNKHSYIQQ